MWLYDRLKLFIGTFILWLYYHLRRRQGADPAKIWIEIDETLDRHLPRKEPD